MRNLIVTLMMIFGASIVYGQQVPVLSQYMFNQLIINPAFAGNANHLKVSLSYRTQYTDIEGAPQTQIITVDAPVEAKSMAFGLKIVNDEIGVTQTSSVSGIYSYLLGVGSGKLGIAIEGGLISSTISFDDLIILDPDDQALIMGTESVIYPDASFGLFFNTEKLYAGFSIQHLISSKIQYTDYNRDQIAKLNKHFNFTIGKWMKISKSLALQPSLLFKMVAGVPLQFDINSRLIYKNAISIGASYRTGDAFVALIEYTLFRNIRIGYSFDYSVSQFAKYTGNSHEFLVSYRHNLPDPPRKKFTDPRFYF
ncbi:MAG: type IX secretion system membrane protein PorP/SprF [Bacteroidetes bacterium]|nr:type IX secretion system membrane protein PorP/SprF [Bacteroidota bacterium]